MKPILFNTEMVKAILDGRKTATRRAVKIPEKYTMINHSNYYILLEQDDMPSCHKCLQSKYVNGDILYVRETFAVGKIDIEESPNGIDSRYVLQGYGCKEIIHKEYCLRNEIGIEDVVWKPSIFMPKEAARLFLRITDVRIERLQEITEEQARKEGFDMTDTPVNAFSHLWDSTIKKVELDKYRWNADPLVWAYEFEVISKEEAMKESDER